MCIAMQSSSAALTYRLQRLAPSPTPDLLASFAPAAALDDIEYLLRRDVLFQLHQFRILRLVNIQFGGDRFDQSNQASDFMFGQQAHLQIKISPLVRLLRHPVLSDQDKRR